MRLFIRWLRLPHEERVLLLQAAVALARAKLELALQDRPAAVLRMRPRRHAGSVCETAKVAGAIDRVANGLCVRASCLVRALAARALLARYGHSSELHIGAAATGGQPLFHAWLVSNGAVVTGARADLPQFELLLASR